MAVKAKMSFDKARVKQFFLTHGEKVALAIGVLLSAYVAYGAVQIESYPKTTQDLTKDVTKGRDSLNTSHSKERFDPTLDGIVLPTKEEGFVAVIERELVKPLSPVFYAILGVEWNGPLFETKRRRGDPKYLAVTDLVPVFHHGAVEMKGADQGGGIIRGEEWICVTGLVPFDDQTTEYTKVFRNSFDAITNATPTYKLYEIRRAEVSTLDPNEAVDWEKIQPLNLQAAVVDWLAKWNEGAVEPSPTGTASWPPLTEPLPPLPNKDFAGWSVHPKLAAEALSNPPPAAPAVAPPTAAPKAQGVNNPFGAAAPAPAPAPAVAAQPADGQPQPAAQRPKQLNFRFIDFDVEPGKRYRYQVKLVLNNPNFNLNQANLERPDMAVGETRDAPWSDPSPPVGVPHLEQLFAGAYKSVGGDLEPEIGVALKWWFPNLAAEGYVKFDEQLRGAILNGSVKVAYFTPGKSLPTTTDLPFTSNVLVVDFGHEKTDAKLQSASGRPIQRPAEALMLNPRGELKIALQTMDSPLWAVQRAAAGAGGAGGAPGGVAAPAPGGAAPPAAAPPADVKSILNLK